MAELFHFTCRHAAARIGRAGELQPARQPMLMGRPVVWATDLAEPDRDALGLTSETLRCDRTEVRYEILDADAFEPWFLWWPHKVDPRIVPLLTMPPHEPRHWFVAVIPVAAIRS